MAPTYMAPTDLDSFCVSVDPENLLVADNVKTIPVSLVSEKVHLRDHSEYDGWVYAGRRQEYYKIHPDYKEPLIRELLSITPKRDMFEAANPTSLVTSPSHQISANTFFRALTNIGCDTVRIQNYGLKDLLPVPDPADPTHFLAETNMYDLGINYDRAKITLLDFVHRLPRKTAETFSLLFPLGKDYGSIRFNINYNGHDYYVKMYPRIAHLIKNFDQGALPTRPPNLLVAFKRAFTMLETRITHFSDLPDWRFTGLRVEVTVHAETLKDAIKQVSATPLLNPWFFIGPKDPQLQDYALRYREFDVQSYLDNVQKHAGIARRLPKLLIGRANTPTSKMQKQIIVDLYNALGWNPGYRTASEWRTDIGWWVEEGDSDIVESDTSYMERAARNPSPPAAPLPADMTDRILTYDDVQMYRLFDRIKEALHTLPCHNLECTSATAQYSKDGGKKVFRLKCKHCRKTIPKGAGRQRFIDLINNGDIDIDLHTL
ncbi:hypothetical protein CF326_g8741 [Tilletia indica]|nr:hypothetical protein CF326_g8741 [Tilletia indica]